MYMHLFCTFHLNNTMILITDCNYNAPLHHYFMTQCTYFNTLAYFCLLRTRPRRAHLYGFQIYI